MALEQLAPLLLPSCSCSLSCEISRQRPLAVVGVVGGGRGRLWSNVASRGARCNSASLHLHLPFVIVIVIVNANGIVNEYVPAVAEPFFMLISSTFTQSPLPPYPCLFTPPPAVWKVSKRLWGPSLIVKSCFVCRFRPRPHRPHKRT